LPVGSYPAAYEPADLDALGRDMACTPLHAWAIARAPTRREHAAAHSHVRPDVRRIQRNLATGTMECRGVARPALRVVAQKTT